MIRLPSTLWAQLALVAIAGGSAGMIYRHQANVETEWLKTHYRLNEAMSFPLHKGISFEQQHLIDGTGQRINLPLPEGRAVDYNGATWWRVDESGRMRFWNEAREEVSPAMVLQDGR